MTKNDGWILTWLADFETWDRADDVLQLHEVTVSPKHFPGMTRTFWSMVEVDLERGFVLFYGSTGDAQCKYRVSCAVEEVKL